MAFRGRPLIVFLGLIACSCFIYFNLANTQTSEAKSAGVVSFDAKYDNHKVNLSWTTVSEKNLSYFSVERSADGKNFSMIALIKSAGNSIIKQSYNYSDQNPLPGISYYCLRETHVNGDFLYTALEMINAE